MLDSLNMTKVVSASNESVLNSIGNTPLQKLNVGFRGQTYGIFGKLEFVNPSGSIKDRIAKYMIEQAEQRGLLGPGSIIVEATSGNTGIALSMVAAAKGYKMLVVMPEHMTGERVKIMANLGACICLTPKNEGFEGAVARANDMSKSDRHYFLTDQFRNPDNIMAHYHTTGQEIIQQVDGKIDAFVAGVGTGGTLMGVGKALREKNEKIRLIAVEPDEAAVLSGQKDLRDHKIAGIGDGFVPEIVNMSVIDQVVRVRSDDAVEMTKKLSTNLGLMVGVSSGANVLASIQVLDEIGRDKKVVTVLPDRAERYFSTDLFLADETQIRQCTMHCECPFYMRTHSLPPPFGSV